MAEFERRGLGPTRGLFLHGYDELDEPVDCDCCEHQPTRVYRVSYDGVEAKFTLCPLCWSQARQRWGGFDEMPGGPGKPRAQ